MNILSRMFGLRKSLRRSGVDERPLVFLHIPKSAGTSVNWFLRQRYPAGEHFWLNADGATEPYPIPEKPVACYSGHVGYGFVRRMNSQARLFTILRNPIERSLSAYYYFRQTPREYLQRVAPVLVPTHDLTLGEFIEQFPETATAYFGNHQTAMLSSPRENYLRYWWDQTPNLDQARENLSRCLVGLVEQLNQSLRNLCQECDWVAPDEAPRLNTTKRPISDKLDARTRDWLEVNTTLDSQLYQQAATQFQEWTNRLQRETPQRTAMKPVREFQLSFDQPIPGHGWHPREQSGTDYFCWCPEQAWLVCPPIRGGQIEICIETLPLLEESILSPFRLKLDGEEVQLDRESSAGGIRFRGRIRKASGNHGVRLDFQAERPFKTSQYFPETTNDRVLSFAIKRVELKAA